MSDGCVLSGNNATAADNKTDGSWVGGRGGGIAAGNATVAIAGSQLLNNTAWIEGGAVHMKGSTLSLNQTKVAFNNASKEDITFPGFGGGLWCLDSQVTVTGCNISFNTGWDGGGGLNTIDSNVTVSHSTMLSNTCPGSSSAGGLIYVWGTGAAPVEVVFGNNVNISNSSATSGGALFVDFNTAATADFAMNGSKISVKGSVLLQHNSASFGQDVIVKGRPFLHLEGSNLRVSNSSVMRQELCVVGDSRSADGYCGLCPAQMLSLDPNHTQLCQPCPDHATCVGGAVVVADSGFFNSGDLGDKCNLSTIIRCPNPLACKHNASAVALHQLHPHFTYMTSINLSAPPAEARDWTSYTSRLCDTGYEGLLCGNCQDNFGQTDAFSCSVCLSSGDGGINTRGIGALLAAYAIVFVAIVWSTIAMIMLEHQRGSGSFRGDTAFRVGLVRHVATTTREESAAGDDDELRLTDVIKALIMYAQYFAGIIAKLPVAWPAALAVPLEQLSESWSRAMGASASLDCVLKTVPAGIDPAGLKALINLLMPLAMFLFVLLWQTVWWACKRQRVWLLAAVAMGLQRLLGVLWSDGSPAGSASARISKLRRWCIRQQLYASRSSGWLRGVSGLREYMRDRWVVSFLVTVFFFYPSVVRVAVGMFTCITVCEERYWVMNVDKLCPLDDPTSLHGRWAFGVGIPALLLLAAVPISVASLLWAAVHKNLLDVPRFQQRFGFMFSDYRTVWSDADGVARHQGIGRPRLTAAVAQAKGVTRMRRIFKTVSQALVVPRPKSGQKAAATKEVPRLGSSSSSDVRPPHLWRQICDILKHRVILAWDAVIHMQTVVLVFMSVFGLVMHEFYQTLILAAVFGSYLLLVLWLRPFRGQYAQQLQAQSTAVLFVTCCLVLTFIPPEGMDERQHRGYKRAADVAGWLLLVLNIVFVVYGLWHMLQRLRQKVRRRSSQQQTAGTQSSKQGRLASAMSSSGGSSTSPCTIANEE